MPKPGSSLIEKLQLEADYQRAWGYVYAADLMEQAIKQLKSGTNNPR